MNITEITEITEMNLCRGRILGLFAELLLDSPSYNNVKALFNILSPFAQGCGSDCPPKLFEGLFMLNKWLQETTPEDAEKLLSAGFTRLFFIGKYSIGSTASYYLSANHVNKQAPWDDVVDFYYKHKYVPAKGKQFDEDSAGVEILFLSILAQKGVEELPVQIEFYEKHVNIWFPKFCAAVRDTSPEGSFFAAFALILEGYISAEYSILVEIRDFLGKNA